jgi:hypothetical protein
MDSAGNNSDAPRRVEGVKPLDISLTVDAPTEEEEGHEKIKELVRECQKTWNIYSLLTKISQDKAAKKRESMRKKGSRTTPNKNGYSGKSGKPRKSYIESTPSWFAESDEEFSPDLKELTGQLWRKGWEQVNNLLEERYGTRPFFRVKELLDEAKERPFFKGINPEEAALMLIKEKLFIQGEFKRQDLQALKQHKRQKERERKNRKTSAIIAQKQNLSRSKVERLRTLELAGPDLLEKYRAGEITLKAAINEAKNRRSTR